MAKHDVTETPFSQTFLDWLFRNFIGRRKIWRWGRYWKFCVDICSCFWGIEKIPQGEQNLSPPQAGRVLNCNCKGGQVQDYQHTSFSAKSCFRQPNLLSLTRTEKLCAWFRSEDDDIWPLISRFDIIKVFRDKAFLSYCDQCWKLLSGESGHWNGGGHPLHAASRYPLPVQGGGLCNSPMSFSDMATESPRGSRWNFEQFFGHRLHNFRQKLTGSGQVTELWRHKRYSLRQIFQGSRVFSHVTCCN